MKRQIASKLTPEQYDLIYKYDEEQCTTAEIGRRIGASPNSVRLILLHQRQYVAPKYEKPIPKEKKQDTVFENEFEREGGYFCIDKWARVYNQQTSRHN